MINFASDNYSTVHPRVLTKLQEVNTHPAPAYGNDVYTAEVIQKFKQFFGEKSETFFIWNGTAANILSLKSILRPYQAVLCTDVAHLQRDECGALEEHIPAPD